MAQEVTDANDATTIATVGNPAQTNAFLYIVTDYLTPRFLVAATVVAFILASTGGVWFSGPLFLAAFFGAILIMISVALYTEAALLLSLIAHLLLAPLPDFEIAGKVIGLDGMMTTALTAAFLVLLPFRRPTPWLKPYFWALAGFVFLALISLRLSPDFAFSSRVALRIFGYLVTFCIAYAAAAKPGFPEWMEKVCAAIAVTLLLMGVLQMMVLLKGTSFAEYIARMADADLEFRLNGFQDIPQLYGNTLMVCLPVVMAMAWQTSKRRETMLLYGLALCILAAIVLTGVRSILGGVVVVLVLFMVAMHRYRLLASFAVMFMVVGLGTGVFQARLDEFLNPERDTEWTSLDDRREIWAALAVGIAESPIQGHGLGSVYDYTAMSPLRHTAIPMAAHSDYRRFAFEMGIPGAFLFVAMWGSVAWAGWLRRKAPNPRQRLLGTTVSALACGFLVISVVEGPMQDYSTMTLFWALAGTALGFNGEASEESAESSPERETSPANA